MYLVEKAMPRKSRSYNLDERVIDVVRALAQKENMSQNRYLENLLFIHGQQRGEIPMSAKPLGETRGGDFTSSKKKESTTEESSANAT